MKIAVIVFRVLMGLLLLFASGTYFFGTMPQQELTGNVKTFMEGVMASQYLMPFIKGTEFVCGLAFVSGFFVPLAAVVMAPITLNIFLFHYFNEPSGLGAAIFLVVANIVVAMGYRDRFAPILRAK